MTKQDLHGHKIGEVVVMPGFQAMLVYLNENTPLPDTRTPRDAVTVANDEGFLRGYLHAVREIRTIHSTPAPPKRETVEHYQAPKSSEPESK